MYLNDYLLFVCDPIFLYVKPSITCEDVNLSQPEEPPNSSTHSDCQAETGVCLLSPLSITHQHLFELHKQNKSFFLFGLSV